MKCTFYNSVSEQGLFTFSKAQCFYTTKKKKKEVENLVYIVYNHTVIISFISLFSSQAATVHRAPMALFILNTVLLLYLPPHPKFMQNFKEH